MAKELIRRIARIEQQLTPEAPSESNLMALIFASTLIVLPPKLQFSRLLKQALDHIDGGARLIPEEPQIQLKGNRQ